MAKDPRPQLAKLVDIGRPMLLSVFKANSCVMSTRLAVEHLRAHGFRAEPRAVSLEAFNPAAWRRVHELGRLPEPETFRRWKMMDDKVWRGAIGVEKAGDELGGWDGHLVCIVEGSWLLDLSADQLTRPQYDFYPVPFYVSIQPGALKTGSAIVLDEFQGGGLVYRPLDDSSYLTFPDWRRLEPLRPILAALRRSQPVPTSY